MSYRQIWPLFAVAFLLITTTVMAQSSIDTATSETDSAAITTPDAFTCSDVLIAYQVPNVQTGQIRFTLYDLRDLNTLPQSEWLELQRIDLVWDKSGLNVGMSLASQWLNNTTLLWSGENTSGDFTLSAISDDPDNDLTPEETMTFIAADRKINPVVATDWSGAFLNVGTFFPNSIFEGTRFHFYDPVSGITCNIPFMDFVTPDTATPLPTNTPVPTHTAVLPSPTDEPSPTWTPSFTPSPGPSPTTTVTSTPAPCTTGVVQLRFVAFREFGVVEFEVVNPSAERARLYGFRINWPDPSTLDPNVSGILRLDKITIGGEDADDYGPGRAGVLLWDGDDPAPNTSQNDQSTVYWNADYMLPSQTTLPIFIDFGGTGTTLDIFGIQGYMFNNTYFDFWCESNPPTQAPPTPLPTYTLTPTDGPSPTSTVNPTQPPINTPFTCDALSVYYQTIDSATGEVTLVIYNNYADPVPNVTPTESEGGPADRIALPPNEAAITLERIDLVWYASTMVARSVVLDDTELLWSGQNGSWNFTLSAIPNDPDNDLNSSETTFFVNADRRINARVSTSQPGVTPLLVDFSNFSSTSYMDVMLRFYEPTTNSTCAVPLSNPKPTATWTPGPPTPIPTDGPLPTWTPAPTSTRHPSMSPTVTFTPSPTYTPVACTVDSLQVNFVGFTEFGVAEFAVINSSSSTRPLNSFSVKWPDPSTLDPDASGILRLDKISIGGVNADDYGTGNSGVLIWDGNDLEPNTSPSDSSTVYWNTNYMLPGQTTLPIFVDFGGTGTTLDAAFGITPVMFNGTNFYFGCEGDPTATPTSPGPVTATPQPTNGPSATPTFYPTERPVNTPFVCGALNVYYQTIDSATGEVTLVIYNNYADPVTPTQPGGATGVPTDDNGGPADRLQLPPNESPITLERIDLLWDYSGAAAQSVLFDATELLWSGNNTSSDFTLAANPLDPDNDLTISEANFFTNADRRINARVSSAQPGITPLRLSFSDYGPGFYMDVLLYFYDPSTDSTCFVPVSNPQPTQTPQPTNTLTPQPTHTPPATPPPSSNTLPAYGLGIDVGELAPIHPVYSWNHWPNQPLSAEWYNIIVDQNGIEIENEWFIVGDVCAGSSCEVALHNDLAGGLPSGNYTWRVQSWSNAGNFSNSVIGPSYSVNMPAPSVILPLTPPEDDVTYLSGNAIDFIWGRHPRAAWYRLYVVTPTGTPDVDMWYNALEICDDTTCAAPGIPLTVGVHTWYMQGWGAGGFGPWNSGTEFDVNDPTEINRITPDGTVDAPVIFSWEHQGETWYRVAGIDAANNLAFDIWWEASQYCDAAVCTVEIDMPAGDYQWWIQGWRQGTGFTAWNLRGMAFDVR